MIDSHEKTLSISSQCALFSVPRSTYYYEPIPETEENLLLMQEIDKLYIESPAYGSRLMTASLIKKGFRVNRKRISRLMKNMGVQAIYPKQKISTSHPGHKKFPYLLKNLEITTQDQVWGTDITYIPVYKGYLYLVTFLDLFSRYALSWSLSNSLESAFCLEALEMAFERGTPQIINSDQGVQYTSQPYIDLVRSREVGISMTGRGRCWDNIFVERFWRTLKQEEVFPSQYYDYAEAYKGISSYMEKYNNKRPHSSLNYRTPLEVYSRAQGP